MLLSKLIRDLPYLLETRGNLETEIGAVVSSSHEKNDRGIFFCIVGARFDGHSFAEEAIANGCVALVVERFLPLDVPQVRVSDGRAAMARICAAFYDYPATKMKMCAITGTKGKTTTSYMFKSIVEAAGYKCGLIGTTGTLIGTRKLVSHLTTPDPVELQRTLHAMVEEGCTYACMEVSAHAVDMHRLDGMSFDVGCYTNLSQDHLDYFGTMEKYFEAKKSFIVGGQCRNVSLNADDETVERIVPDVTVPKLTYSISANSDLYARDIEISENGVDFNMSLHNTQAFPVHLVMTGMFNVYNALAAASCAMILGIDAEDIRKGLEAIQAVPGRIEMLQTGTPYKIILDYSHSPDALKNILKTVRQFAKGRVIALFGCGGDRDHQKRPIMGRIGGLLADYCVLTSDNPRSEDPMKILASIEEGIKPTGKPYTVIENRREAIRFAMQMAEEGDIIVLAGKGHETYQEIMGEKKPFDEKQVVKELLRESGVQA
ncbi:MAG: UDP-N-acetylmuramoyl-L-alanyl-D-glutamate--2,6-diaminopimelate ligase [Clostridia bacterium]|nr:UDP-N-acetylmuramoyl-L-alanyl-D-glutamate--2,6-diaminopimelate ligase [Clostridia bacterium]MBR1685103.1 UDP-N-acetylmuramoyl-L-alanyl-D-glutamate--2,6-diaminopimelate ligase [Clostridia bacterium]MBR2288184.1 UDP-N-acetylmuramoyl-L-alanyl-D-glutamate--2,6-diaminopimelate ligase [Clostridia bacterium]